MFTSISKSNVNTRGVRCNAYINKPENATQKRIRNNFEKACRLVGLTSKIVISKYITRENDAFLGKLVCDNLRTMGPTYVKIGQFISTRSDIFGKDFTSQLAVLQDQVSPMNLDDTKEMISVLMTDNQGLFQFIAEEPIAAASIGQVHYGKLMDNTEIVVKLKRKGIETVIKDDFRILFAIVSIIRMFSQHRQVQEVEISLREYYALLLEEIDFAQEVRNMVRFAEQFKNVNWLKIPIPYEELCFDNAIVMEYVPSIKIDDISSIEKESLRRNVISQKLLECFFKQIVEHGFVHIDPHPGNVGIIPSTGKIVFYDYGMFVELNGILKDNVKQLLIALYDRDVDDVCEMLVRYDIIKLESDRAPYFKKFVASFMSYLDNLDVTDFKVSYLDRIDQSQMQFLISSKFVLLLRGISIMEGNCKRLDADFNYRTVLDPFINDFVMDVSYIEKRGAKDIQRFTNTSNRIVTSEISLGMVEKDIETLKKQQNHDNAKLKLCMIVILVTNLFQPHESAMMQNIGIGVFLYILYNK